MYNFIVFPVSIIGTAVSSDVRSQEIADHEQKSTSEKHAGILKRSYIFPGMLGGNSHMWDLRM